MSKWIKVYLDNYGILPPKDAKERWIHLLDRIDGMNGVIDGFERMDRVELAFKSNDNIQVRHVEDWYRCPKWTSTLMFSIWSLDDGVITNERCYEIALAVKKLIKSFGCVWIRLDILNNNNI
jgi:hypothetical protein